MVVVAAAGGQRCERAGVTLGYESSLSDPVWIVRAVVKGNPNPFEVVIAWDQRLSRGVEGRAG